MSAHRRWPIVKRFRKPSIPITLIRNKRGVLGSSRAIKLTFEPLEPGSGIEFESTVVGGNVPKEYIPVSKKG